MGGCRGLRLLEVSLIPSQDCTSKLDNGSDLGCPLGSHLRSRFGAHIVLENFRYNFAQVVSCASPRCRSTPSRLSVEVHTDFVPRSCADGAVCMVLGACSMVTGPWSLFQGSGSMLLACGPTVSSLCSQSWVHGPMAWTHGPTALGQQSWVYCRNTNNAIRLASM